MSKSDIENKDNDASGIAKEFMKTLVNLEENKRLKK